jgi:cephalosporin-C deacetylase-like acetyl esterase
MPAESPTFLEFIRHSAQQLRGGDHAPKSLEEWNAKRERLRRNLQTAWGPFPKTPAPLEPKVVGELKRDGYRIEKVLFQTRPDVWMTANIYIPTRNEGDPRLPAVLCVHGHWRGAKQDPAVQSRCIGLVKLGFVVLVVDAFGAGERAIGTKLGEYHGEMTAGTLWPIGLPLSGLQVYENMRAVDYLISRPEVDPERIGVTGASGGGNQSMYAGAWDERLKAVVPVCSVGNYQAYLGAACCMCEVVPSALQFTEEWAVLGLVAPRALMIISATKDARQFSVEEAKKSLELTGPVFELHGEAKRLRHAIFESPHDYNRPMREAMYGWMTLHLKEEGDGSPMDEPEIKTEDPEELRCFPGDSRPEDYVTIPRFAARQARELVAKKPLPDHLEYWESEEYLMREGLARVLGPEPEKPPLDLEVTEEAEGRRLLQFTSEPHVRLVATHLPADSKRWAIVVDPAGMEKTLASEYAAALREAGWNIVAPELRATGTLAVPGDTIGRAPDHNSAQWSLWIGRPLLAQWAFDVRRAIDALLASIEGVPEEIGVIGLGTGGPIALLAAAQDETIVRIATADSLSTYVFDEPYQEQRMGLLVPAMLRQVGDLPHLAAMVAPRRMLIAGPTNGAAKELPENENEERFQYARKAYQLRGGRERLVVSPKLSPQDFATRFAEL